MGMPKHVSDSASVWRAIVEASGNRKDAAVKLGVSERTLERYIKQYDLIEMMDKAGYTQRKGPPRGGIKEGQESSRHAAIRHAVEQNDGRIDYRKLALAIYGSDSPEARRRVYSAMNDMKLAGKIAHDGARWFVIGT